MFKFHLVFRIAYTKDIGRYYKWRCAYFHFEHWNDGVFRFKCTL